MYVCIYVCVCVYDVINVYACTYNRPESKISLNSMYVCMYICIYICVCVCDVINVYQDGTNVHTIDLSQSFHDIVSLCIYMCVYVCVCKCMYTCVM